MGSKGGSSQRALTEEEKELFSQQTKSLQLADSVAVEQNSLSKEDRAYFNRIYRGQADANDPEVKAAISKALQEARAAAPESGKEKSYMTMKEFSTIVNENSRDVSAMKEKMQEAYSAYKISNAIISGIDEDSIRQQVIDSFSSGQSVDELLFDAVKASKSDLATALTSYADKSAAISKKYGADRAGVSSKYTSRINDLAGQFDKKMEFASNEFVSASKDALGKYNTDTGRYQSAFEEVSGKAMSEMGRADTDILSQQRGQQLAGISQAYAEAQNQLLGTLGRRGLAGSGIEASSLVNMSNQEAMAKAGALSQSYTQSIGLSDARRLQRVGMQGDVSQMGIGVAGGQLEAQQAVGQGIFGARQTTAEGQLQAGSQAAQTEYQAGMTNVVAAEQAALQREAMMYQASVGNTQQNIANLQLASGTSQGVYGGASNMLAGAGQTANQSAQIAGSTAVGIGGNDVQYKANQGAAQGALAGGIMSAAASIGSAALMSDERLKTNIQPTGDVVNGHKIYTWDWNDTFYDLGYENTYNEGVIAQEVLEINPDAVSMDSNGYYRVNYSMIGV